MEPEERLTKRERRERARQERKQRETTKVKETQHRKWLTVLGVAAGIAGVAALIWVTREEPAPTGIVVAAAEAEQAAETAGCEVIDIPPPATVAHIPQDGAPDPAVLYDVRPTHAGPHFDGVNPVGVFSSPQDERLVVHNLEHGAVVVWYDPDLIGRDDLRALETWAEDRNRAGFHGRAGSAVIVSPYPVPLDSGKALAFRAWMVAVDCDGFAEEYADGFLATHYGTRGIAPERALGPYPREVLDLDGRPDAPGLTPQG